MVVLEWVKVFYNRGERPELYYWRSKTGMEVDLIIDRNGRLYPIEIKATSTVLPGHLDALTRWREMAGSIASEGLLVASVSEPFTLRDCRVTPWQSTVEW
jgi:predicted AAA+ superfamily ATPase